MVASKKLKLGFLAAAALGAAAMALTPLAKSVYAETEGESPAFGFGQSYMVGETVEIPSRKLTEGDKSYDSCVLVTTPAGVTLTGSEAHLSEAGKYTVTYVANRADGTVLKEEYSFIACDNLYSVTSSLSSVTYGHTLAGYEITTDAVLASVSSRDRFLYNPMVDLNALGGKEFIEFFVTPEVIGTPDAMKIQIVLTDAHDEDNFVVISIKKGTAAQAGAAWAERNSYITANAVGQVPAGLENGYTGIEVYGKQYRLQKGTVWGANLRFSMPGNPAYVSLDDPQNDPDKVATQSLKISLDNETGDIYANGQLVTVLKNSDIYDDVLWKGFTTGECYLSVYGEGFNSAALGLGIVSLGGESMREGGENKFIDDTAPVISIDAGGEAQTPRAVAGKPYRLFAVEAVDDYSGRCEVVGSVYYNTPDGARVRADVKDGCFTPFKAGSYTVEYTAADRYGNVAVETVEIIAEADSSALLVAEIADAADGEAGCELRVPVPEFSNARGNCRWEAVASLNGNDNVAYKITSENPVFTPEYAGAYTLTYTYGDYVTEGKAEKTFNVGASRKPVIDGMPVLPEYLILGCEYNLPSVSGTVYTDGTPVRKVCGIYVSEDGGAERAINGKLITYANSYAEVIYRISDGDGSEVKSAKIPVIDVGYNGNYKIEKYFYGDGFSTVTDKDYIRFTADGAQGETAATTFINPLQTFDFSLRVYASGKGFNSISVILSSASDIDSKVKFTYRNEGGQVMFSVNGGSEVALTATAFNDPTSPLTLSFNGFNNTVMPTGVSSLAYKVTHDTRGNEFKGFENMSAYMTVELGGITDKNSASVNIVSLNGQKISNVYTDITKPQLSAATASGDRLQGTEYVIPKVYAADVLDVVTGTMSVTAPDGSFAVSKDGVVIGTGSDISRDYTIVLSQFGAYTVRYEVADICGNKLTYEYVLRAADFTPPEVEVVSPVTEGAVGAQIKVADIRISDNRDEKVEDFTVFVTVTTPDFRSHSLISADGKCAATFTASYAGEYTVTYLVLDSSGNMGSASYKIDVR